jgi:hypothetical protein
MRWFKALFSILCCFPPALAEPSVVGIVASGGGYRLLRNGQPYFTKGAVGAVHLEELAAAGGNSIRAGTNSLDRAQALGLAVLADLPFAKQRTGFSYDDQAAVDRQREQIRQIVLRFKDHPALLAWAVGNELEINTTAIERAALWKEMNRVARLIHQIDPNHPVITPIGDAYKRMLGELNQYCPDLDAVGLNSYADMLTLPEDIAKQGWTRPYWVTEFGPRGHWQVEKTAWRLPIEDNSSQKADFYRRAYEHAVQGQPNCLGSFVFHWAQHHEKTHTWYGMFLEDGSRTEAVDVMTFLWSGKWPAHRSPRVGPAAITRGGAQGPAVVAPGAVVEFRFDVSDPGGDPLRISWDLRKDVSGNPNVGGDREEPTPPIEGAIVSSQGDRASVRIPDREGVYRLFAYARDGHGSAATANVPLLAQAPKYPPAPPERPGERPGAGIERTMSLLATSTPARRNPVRILFYGQSITKQEWSQLVAQDIRTRFPYADLTVENRAIGGYSSEYLVRTVGHDVFAFYPDLIVFHDYGGEENYEKIIAGIASHTTAEILIQSDYPAWAPVEGQPSDAAKARSEEWHDRHCYEWLPELCRRYGCGLLDVRRPWTQYLKENHLAPTDVLSDGTHLNAQGNWLLAELTKRYLRYDASLPQTARAGQVRNYAEGGDFRWAGGRIRLQFDGNRIDAIAAAGGAYHADEADVLIDGKKPSEFPELYFITRPTDTFNVDWPAVNSVSAGKPLLVEDWTLRVLETNADDSRWRFEVIGSRTGRDGEGVSTERFVSRSGRVVIEPADYGVKRAFDLRHILTPVGFEVKWCVEPMFSDVYRAPRVADPSREESVILALGLANGKHTLELSARGKTPPPIKAIRVYRPPLR